VLAPAERHDVLDLVGTEQSCKLPEIGVFLEVEVLLPVEEEGVDEQFEVLLLEEVVPEGLLPPRLFIGTVLPQVLTQDVLLQLQHLLTHRNHVLRMVRIEFLLVLLVLGLQVHRTTALALPLRQWVGLLNELVEIEPTVLLQLLQHFQLPKHRSQIKHDATKEGNLVDNAIDVPD
jgi:hypothetical protein